MNDEVFFREKKKKTGRLGVLEYGVMKIHSLTDLNLYIPFWEEKSHYMQHDVLCKKRIIQDNANHQMRKSLEGLPRLGRHYLSFRANFNVSIIRREYMYIEHKNLQQTTLTILRTIY